VLGSTFLRLLIRVQAAPSAAAPPSDAVCRSYSRRKKARTCRAQGEQEEQAEAPMERGRRGDQGPLQPCLRQCAGRTRGRRRAPASAQGEQEEQAESTQWSEGERGDQGPLQPLPPPCAGRTRGRRRAPAAHKGSRREQAEAPVERGRRGGSGPPAALPLRHVPVVLRGRRRAPAAHKGSRRSKQRHPWSERRRGDQGPLQPCLRHVPVVLAEEGAHLPRTRGAEGQARAAIGAREKGGSGPADLPPPCAGRTHGRRRAPAAHKGSRRSKQRHPWSEGEGGIRGPCSPASAMCRSYFAEEGAHLPRTREAGGASRGTHGARETGGSGPPAALPGRHVPVRTLAKEGAHLPRTKGAGGASRGTHGAREKGDQGPLQPCLRHVPVVLRGRRRAPATHKGSRIKPADASTIRLTSTPKP